MYYAHLFEMHGHPYKQQITKADKISTALEVPFSRLN